MSFQRHNHHFKAFVHDLTHLESSIKHPIHGIIGISFLKRYILTINFIDHVMYFNPINFLGKPLHAIPNGSLPFWEISMKYKKHLLVAEVEANAKQWRMGIDTGVSTNVISRTFLKQARSRFTYHKKQVKVVTVDKSSQHQHYYLMQGMKLAGHTLPTMRCSLVNLAALNAGLEGYTLHGLLGYEFLKQYAQVAFHFQTKKLYLWERNKTTPKPAFVNK